MKMRMTRSTAAMGSVASLALAAAVLLVAMDVSESHVAAPVVAQAKPQKGAAQAPAPPLPLDDWRKRVRAARAKADVFAVKSFYDPPPLPAPVAESLPEAAPVAPALPFTYLGRLQEIGSEPIVFLVRGERLYTVRVGEVIDDAYRLESLTPDEAVFVYLPMDVTQTLVLTERS